MYLWERQHNILKLTCSCFLNIRLLILIFLLNFHIGCCMSEMTTLHPRYALFTIKGLKELENWFCQKSIWWFPAGWELKMVYMSLFSEFALIFNVSSKESCDSGFFISLYTLGDGKFVFPVVDSLTMNCFILILRRCKKMHPYYKCDLLMINVSVDEIYMHLWLKMTSWVHVSSLNQVSLQSHECYNFNPTRNPWCNGIL